MKSPSQWFEDAETSGRYDLVIISILKECISDAGLDVDKIVTLIQQEGERDE
jgi:hypothetical protein